MAEALKPLVWLEGEIKTPPFSKEGRVEAGTLLLRLQRGESLGMPHSRPMPGIGKGCHELRVRDGGHNWHRLEPDCILILDVMQKKTQKTPAPVVDACQRRLADYRTARDGGKARG
jgi:phage-related protein